MKRIILLSDTHGYIDERILAYCESSDEIWHAGDIGTLAVADALEKTKKTFRAVYGNIDGQEIRIRYPKINRFRCEDVDVLLTHIAGRPENYLPEIKTLVEENPPKLVVCGHSHILLVKFEKKYNLLHLNPGAAGKSGFHQKRTLLQFTIAGKEIKDLQVIELGNR
ncbi:MAG TPA: metallophosphoesterase family protein [Bacteroidia bacterium]|nr:metallophosphoesterase family protein [Bacteroidia bacterium]